MMQYRLVCIFDRKTKGVTIEVCLETGKKNLSPFQRKITVSDLMRSEQGNENALIKILFYAGFEKQPFVIHPFQRFSPIVSNVLANWPWKYVRYGSHNSSIKKFISCEHYIWDIPKYSFDYGVIVGGELYITDTNRWWRNIVVRFRYEGTSLLFPVQDVEIQIPYSTNNGNWFIRDVEKENEYLYGINAFLDVEHSILNLPNEDWGFIKKLQKEKWRLYIRKNEVSTAVVWRKDNYGVDWFAPVSEELELYDEKILYAFLHGKEFVELNGKIALFNRTSMRNLTPEKLVTVLCPGYSVTKLYGLNSDFNVQERNELLSRIKGEVKASLFSYQSEGVIWLANMRKRGVGCMLADDMGLGKTLQVLAYLATIDRRGGNLCFLVVCPASLVANWEKEILRFTPQLHAFITVVSYESLKLHIEKYRVRLFDTVIVDEGQYVKNDNTLRYKILGELSYVQMIMLTGTPIENSIDEIWAQFKLLIPDFRALYKKMLVLGIKNDSLQWVEVSKKLLSPFLLRRIKEDVLTSLPNKKEVIVFVELSSSEKLVYDGLRKMYVTAIENGLLGRINSLALEGLLRLRQCCVSVNILPKNISQISKVKSTKLSKVVELVRRFLDEGHKVLVFSQFTSALDELGGMLRECGLEYLMMTGTTRNRFELVKRFQQKSSERIFLISLKAGGVGLNLTAADRVILVDDWWNPAVESQAFSRTHRIGQLNDVEVFRIICKSTVEEKILCLHEKKKEISDIFNATDGKYSVEQIKNLLND